MPSSGNRPLDDQSSSTLSIKLPDVPGDSPLLGEANVYIERLDDGLADLGLLSAAKGLDIAEASVIKDQPVQPLPPGLNTNNPSDYRLMLALQAVHTQNEANAEKRYHIIMKLYTLLYTKLAASCVANCEHLRRLADAHCV